MLFSCVLPQSWRKPNTPVSPTQNFCGPLYLYGSLAHVWPFCTYVGHVTLLDGEGRDGAFRSGCSEVVYYTITGSVSFSCAWTRNKRQTNNCFSWSDAFQLSLAGCRAERMCPCTWGTFRAWILIILSRNVIVLLDKSQLFSFTVC